MSVKRTHSRDTAAALSRAEPRCPSAAFGCARRSRREGIGTDCSGGSRRSCNDSPHELAGLRHSLACLCVSLRSLCCAQANNASSDRKEEEKGGNGSVVQAPAAEGLSDDEIVRVGGLGPAGPPLPFAVRTRKGQVPYNKSKLNQDRGVVQYNLQGDQSCALWGVMDGHGEFGHYVASFIQEKLPGCIASREELRAYPEKSITDAVKKLCDDLTDTNINVAFSGSTVVFGVKVADMLYTANIGDSRCVMCRQAENGELQAIGLSIDQKPENPKEKARILKAGGRVEPLPGPPGEDVGPPRVWLAEVDVPGLAMSRSIGDEVSQTVGVISVPEIIPHQIQSNDIFAIWASDGVWEFLSNEQAVSIIWKYKHDLGEAVNQLVEEAAKQWRKEEEVIDDITAIVVVFNQPK